MKFKLWSLLPVVTLCLVACATGTKLKPLESRDPGSIRTDRPTEGVAYRVVPEASWLKVLVFRSGALANLGHNHVIRFVGLSGDLIAPVEGQHFGWGSISVEVEKVFIDSPDDRAEAGDRFTTSPTEKDIAGTRSNLLGPKVLAADQHPRVELKIQGLEPKLEKNPVLVSVSLGKLVRELTLPVEIEMEERQLVTRARFALSQSDLGMTPFSVLGGALSVADVLELELMLTAERVDRN